MKAVWDNSPAHKQDIVTFMQGRKEPSSYLNGVLTYWVGSHLDVPFSFLITAPLTQDDTIPDVWKHHLCTHGRSYSIDFGIGNKDFLGRGLATPLLEAFVSFFKEEVDRCLAQFFIEPHVQTAQIKRIHQKAGFHFISVSNEGNEVPCDQTETFLMIKQCASTSSS
ncbi:MAG: GNAT family N-acetyltransferase [Alphaproteobacteria bacterium]|nr:GNAT family N-acetyltransferase [Alphaproteobacteria bacterium]